MKNKFADLTDQAYELQALLENINVLTDDIYKEYFGIINTSKPEAKDLMMLYFKINAIKSGMVRDYMVTALKSVSDLCEHIENLEICHDRDITKTQ